MQIDINLIKNKSDVWINKNYPDIYLFIETIQLGKTWKEKLYIHHKDIKDIPKCYCNKELIYKSFTKGYGSYCSTKCLSNSEEIKNKRKQSCITKYGVENPMQNKIFSEKLKETIFNKYGVENISKLKSIKDKIKKTNINKFGYEYVSQIPSVKNILSDKMIARQEELTTKRNSQIYQYLESKTKNLNIKLIANNSSNYKFLCINCNNEFNIHKNLLNDRIKNKNTICIICNKINSSSDAQEQLYNYIKTIYNGIILKNNRSIINGELDIYLPELQIAIEFNGIYWHSDIYKDKNYHINKTNECINLNIKLIHIWEDEWLQKKEIILSRIKNLIGISNKIYARKCIIKEIDNKEYKLFIEENHLQGFVGAKIKLGLFHNNEIVSVMSFGNLRKNMGYIKQEGCFELLRFCNKLNYSVIGGASKLLNYFIKNNRVLNIISYANIDWSFGELYKNLGFTKLYDTKPNYFYYKNGNRYNRFSFRKDILIKRGYNKSLSESEIMKKEGYYKIYNCGNSKYELKIYTL